MSAILRVILVFLCSLKLAGGATNQGLAVTFSGDNSARADSMVLPNFALYVAARDPATPALPPGPFTATWDGFLNVDLRSDYFFSADVSGRLKLEIGGTTVFDHSANSHQRLLSKAVRLSKGANPLKAIFTSPATGDALLRVGWTEKGTNTMPIPPSALTHRDSAALHHSSQVALSRELFIEHRCAKCHASGEHDAAFQMDAPGFEQLERKADWMARWILNPKALRENARMPRMLHGEGATNDAAAMAAYLASQTEQPANSLAVNSGAPHDRAPLFERLHCNACHDLASGAKAPKISLDQAPQKFSARALVNFLLNPATNYHSIRMPNFKLSAGEAAELTGYLLKGATNDSAVSRKNIDRGKHLVQTSGCLNCHASKIENRYSAPKLSALNWDRGCLAEHHSASKAPRFDFTPEERAALQAFGRKNLASLARHAPMEFALRQTRLLNCGACHGQLDGFPALDILGGKLNAQWMGSFISGEIPYKTRAEKHPGGEPWMEARMPAFKFHGAKLAEGLAALHGYPPQPVPGPLIDATLAEHGRKLVGKDGGFSCISCHGVRSLKAMEVFDAEGINLEWSAERLLPDYYRRWMRNPLAIDPQTKMPAYFEDGQSALTEVLEGDAEKQIDAIWHYLRLRDTMPLPATEPMQ